MNKEKHLYWKKYVLYFFLLQGTNVCGQENQESLNSYYSDSKGSGFHMALIAGSWIPTNALSVLGSHPDLGFQIGGSHKKTSINLTVNFKFQNSKNYYYARRTRSTNTLEYTNHFFGGYIGLDVGWNLYSKDNVQWLLQTGLAIDGFDALKENKAQNLRAESIVTGNVNLGIGYRYYLTDSFYVGLNIKYNFVDYSRSNIIDFTGNPVTIHFLIGGFVKLIRPITF